MIEKQVILMENIPELQVNKQTEPNMDITSKYIQEFEEKSIPRNRNLIGDILREGKKKHHVNTFHGIDISAPRLVMQQIRLKTGEKLSFTAYLVKCVAQAITEHPQVHALIRGIIRKRLIIYNTVDVALFIERDLGK